MCGCGAVKSVEERRGGEGWVVVEEVGRRERDVTTTFWGSLSRVVFRSVQNKADNLEDTF